MDIVLATGGTWGHILPALILARELEVRGYSRALFIDKIDNKIDNNKDSKVESYVLPLCKPSNKFKFVFLLLYSCVYAIYCMRKLKPKLVVGFGSYSSFPTLFAAKMLSIPIVLHEQNSVLGRVNRFFFKTAKLIATSFPDTKYAGGSKCIVLGNFVNVKLRCYRCYKQILNILVIAGSQGANFFDRMVSNVICSLPFKIKRKIKIIQQCRKNNIEKVRSLYERKSINCELSEFFNDMETRLVNAHLIISRAGATSVAEITLAGRPAIYIPYPHSKDEHQFYNAKYIENLGAAIIVEQNNETKKILKKLLIKLILDIKKLYDIADNTRKVQMRNGIIEFIEVITQKFT